MNTSLDPLRLVNTYGAFGRYASALENYQHNPWLVHLAATFLVNDENTESLIAHNPFHGRPRPKYTQTVLRLVPKRPEVDTGGKGKE